MCVCVCVCVWCACVCAVGNRLPNMQYDANEGSHLIVASSCHVHAYVCMQVYTLMFVHLMIDYVRGHFVAYNLYKLSSLD